MIKRLVFFIVSVIAIETYAQSPVISAMDFAVQLKNNKNLVVVDVNSPEIYAKQHIQGAVNLFFRELYQPNAVEGKLRPNTELADILGKKGISNTAKIVVYENESNKHNSRVWWILKSLGAADVSILHFNMEQFAAARIPLTATPASGKATTFVVAESTFKACSADDVKSRAEGALLLDAREKDEFAGADAAKKSKGHIPGAVWMNFKEVLTPTGAYKSKDEIVAAAAKFGATPEKTVIVYCNSGVKASVLYVAMKEIAGFQNVLYYAGSYADWASNPDNQLVQ